MSVHVPKDVVLELLEQIVKIEVEVSGTRATAGKGMSVAVSSAMNVVLVSLICIRQDFVG